MKRIAIIGGTGWENNTLKSTFPAATEETISTRWGKANISRCVMGNRELLFLQRHAAHGGKYHLPPHRINYRANIAALHKCGVELIIAASAVGGLHQDWHSGDFVLLDQIIDLSSGRESTFYDDKAIHVDMTNPYDLRGSQLLRAAAQQQQVSFHEDAVYLCANGPRFETAAEIKLFAQWGADAVGMTAMPEAALARELEIPYCGIAVITNAAAGISANPLTHQEVQDQMKLSLPVLKSIVLAAAKMA